MNDLVKMNKCPVNLLTYIASFLSYKSIASLSLCNKFLYKTLNPEDNACINNIYMQHVISEFFEFDEDDDNNFKNNKNLSGKIYKKQTNWKNFLKEIIMNFKGYKDKTIAEKVKDFFKIHMYLPDLRKENAQLEYESSSIHQIVSYDMNFRSSCNYNYYSKYISKEYMLYGLQQKKYLHYNTDKNNSNIENHVVRILKEGLRFENDLLNFVDSFYSLINNNCLRDLIINNIIKYKYLVLDDIFNNNYKGQSLDNTFINFIIWINHSYIIYSNFVYYYLKTIIDNVDEKTFLIEYTHKYSELINCALLLNSTFGNVNILINQFLMYYPIFKDLKNKENVDLSLIKSPAKSSTRSDINNNNNNNIYKEEFSIYNLFITILTNIVKNNLSDIVVDKFKIILKKYFINLFENFKESDIKKNKKKDDDDEMDYCDCVDVEFNNKIQDERMDVEDDYSNDSMTDNEPSDKEIIQDFINIEVDFIINGNNANAINHTGLKVTERYEKIEEIIINQFTDLLKSYIKQEKPLNILFEIVKKITKCNCCSRSNLFKSSDSLALIRRTKKQLMTKSISILFQKIIEILPKDFMAHAKKNGKEIALSVNDFEVKNNIEFSFNLDNLSSKKKMDVTVKAEKELDNVKNYLIDKIIKPYEEEDIKKNYNKVINNYINYDGIELVSIIKNLIWFYYNELGIYEEKDEKVCSMLNRKCSLKNDNSESNKPYVINIKRLQDENLFISEKETKFF